MAEPDYTSLIDEYKHAGQLPLLWQWRAREYICAANVLRRVTDKTDLFALRDTKRWKPHRTVRMLYGLALEIMLKGLLIAQGVDATSTGKLNQRLQTHNVLVLWKHAGLPLDPQTEQVLKILHWSIEAGKYPIGTKFDAFEPVPYLRASATVNQIMRLLETVEAALHATERVLDKTDLRKLCTDWTET